MTTKQYLKHLAELEKLEQDAKTQAELDSVYKAKNELYEKLRRATVEEALSLLWNRAGSRWAGSGEQKQGEEK